ncbi:hypothetical protein pdam_00014488 [Pocillopora damicornis]|uniref:Uncharacterized protein n=1 Tax=Pocillopora damicornis TaxID=46731 RepID=A0A3M6UZ04_POCDA|nr:hypothetical protein pdam_00014488 [Pocillopora damicornis]
MAVLIKDTDMVLSFVLALCDQYDSQIMPLNPFTPTSNQDRISPYNINTISSRQLLIEDLILCFQDQEDFKSEPIKMPYCII